MIAAPVAREKARRAAWHNAPGDQQGASNHKEWAPTEAKKG